MVPAGRASAGSSHDVGTALASATAPASTCGAPASPAFVVAEGAFAFAPHADAKARRSGRDRRMVVQTMDRECAGVTLIWRQFRARSYRFQPGTSGDLFVCKDMRNAWTQEPEVVLDQARFEYRLRRSETMGDGQKKLEDAGVFDSIGGV